MPLIKTDGTPKMMMARQMARLTARLEAPIYGDGTHGTPKCARTHEKEKTDKNNSLTRTIPHFGVPCVPSRYSCGL